MKKYYKFLIILLVTSFIIPQVALASWWNPLSWNIWDIFIKPKTAIQKPTTANPTTPIEVDILYCNGSKYSKCPIGQNFVCPTNGQDGFCDKGKSSEIKSPKIKEQPSPIPTNPTTNPGQTSKTTPVWDACKNIEGTQSLAPTGMYAENGSCFSISNIPTQNITTPSPQIVVDICRNIEGVQTAIPSGLILQNNDCITPLSLPNISVSQGDASVYTGSGCAGCTVNNYKFINNFVIHNDSKVPLLINGVTYKISSEGIVIGDTSTYQQKMSIGILGATTIPDNLGSGFSMIKTFDLPITIPAGDSRILNFTYNPSNIKAQGIRYLQIEIQAIDTSPVTTNNLPIANRAILY